MKSPRAVPLLLAAVGAFVIAACQGSLTDGGPIPYGFLTFVAQQKGSGYTASSIGTFYEVTGLGAPVQGAAWDSCRLQSYAPSNGSSIGSFFPSIAPGNFVQIRSGTRTDSLFALTLGNETQWRSRLASGIPYTPGDSVTVTIPGADYPALTLKAKTAEAFAVQPFTVAPSTRIDLRWNPGQDANNIVTFSFKYASASAEQLNTNIVCQFKDDGVDSIPAVYANAFANASVKQWTSSRVRSVVQRVSRGGYFDFISTFDYPTPTAP